MSKIIKNVNISWAWEGDTYALQNFNTALTPYGGNPNETVIYKTFVDKEELKNWRKQWKDMPNWLEKENGKSQKSQNG